MFGICERSVETLHLFVIQTEFLLQLLFKELHRGNAFRENDYTLFGILLPNLSQLLTESEITGVNAQIDIFVYQFKQLLHLYAIIFL